MNMPPPPVVLAYGIGVDSTALLIELVARGEIPDLVLSADTSVEKPETYAYLDVIRPWMAAHGIRHEMVSYQPKRFKHWPPYYGLLEMCLTNATLRVKASAAQVAASNTRRRHRMRSSPAGSRRSMHGREVNVSFG